MADRVNALSGSTKKAKRSPSWPSGPPQYDGPADDPAETGASQQDEESAASPGPAVQSPKGGHAEIPAEGADAPRAAGGAGMLPPTTLPQAPTSSSGDTAHPFGIQPFPPPPSTPFGTPPTPHIGPADTQSVASAYSPLTTARRRGLNPTAPRFDGSRAMLNRGPGIQPEARDPMEEPPEREVGVPAATPQQVERRVQAAIHHLAMAFRYLSAADQDEVANRYDGMFQQDFGARYEDQRSRAIQDEPDDPPSE
ncbi:hypothetical protein LTR85_001782 [Meristemomyces frigidus]|nr:hypothetical protein LTR85_001782 [Meristemomyces frigidus]